MRRMTLSALLCLLLLFSFSFTSNASEITISGTAQFKCSLLSKYMKKQDYSFIYEIRSKNNFKTNLYAAKDAEVLIIDGDNGIVRIGQTDNKGHFSVSVSEEKVYQIVVRFHGREINGVASASDAEDFIADLGYFSSEEVGNWLIKPALTYCTTCKLRILEINESL